MKTRFYKVRPELCKLYDIGINVAFFKLSVMVWLKGLKRAKTGLKKNNLFKNLIESQRLEALNAKAGKLAYPVVMILSSNVPYATPFILSILPKLIP